MDATSLILQAMAFKPDAIDFNTPKEGGIPLYAAAEQQDSAVRSTSPRRPRITTTSLPKAIGPYWSQGGRVFIQLELEPLDKHGGDIDNWHAVLDKYGKPSDQRNTFSQAGYLAALAATNALLKLDPAKIDRASVAEAFRNIKALKTDVSCSPWYFGPGDEHNAIHAGSVAEIKDGALRDAQVVLSGLRSRLGGHPEDGERASSGGLNRRELNSKSEVMPDLSPFVIAGLSTGAVYVLAGVGLVVLYRASGVLNLAQGALGALERHDGLADCGFGGPQWIGWIAAVAASTALALFYGRLIAPRLATAIRSCVRWRRSALRLSFSAFASSSGASGRAVCGCRRITCSFALSGRAGHRHAGASPSARLGRRRWHDPVPENEPAWACRCGRSPTIATSAALVGVPVLRVDAWAWVISGVISGVSGIFLANMVRLQVIPLTYMVIPAVAAAILGRLTSLYGRRDRRAGDRRTRSRGVAVSGDFALIAPPRPSLSPGGAALVPARRPDAEPDGPVPVVCDQPSAAELGIGRKFALASCLAIIVAVAVPYLASAYWLKTFTWRHHHCAVQPQRRGAVRPTRHGVALPVCLFGVGGWVALRLYHGFHIAIRNRSCWRAASRRRYSA